MKEELDRLWLLLSQQLQNPEAVSRYEKVLEIRRQESLARRFNYGKTDRTESL